MSVRPEKDERRPHKLKTCALFGMDGIDSAEEAAILRLRSAVQFVIGIEKASPSLMRLAFSIYGHVLLLDIDVSKVSLVVGLSNLLVVGLG